MTRWRWPLALAASEILLSGLWLFLRPQDLFALLDLTARDLSLWRIIGALEIAQGLCLVVCSRRPADYRGFALVPLIGRTLGALLWLWVAQIEWLDIPSFVLIGLILHQILWALLLAAYLLWPLFRSAR